MVVYEGSVPEFVDERRLRGPVDALLRRLAEVRMERLEARVEDGHGGVGAQLAGCESKRSDSSIFFRSIGRFGRKLRKK